MKENKSLINKKMKNMQSENHIYQKGKLTIVTKQLQYVDWRQANAITFKNRMINQINRELWAD